MVRSKMVLPTSYKIHFKSIAISTLAFDITSITTRPEVILKASDDKFNYLFIGQKEKHGAICTLVLDLTIGLIG